MFTKCHESNTYPVCQMFVIRYALVVASLLGGIAAPAAEELTVAGTGASQKMLRELATAFGGPNADCPMSVPDSVGSRGGIRALLSEQASIARVSRPLKDNERSDELTYRPLAQTTVGFVVHPSASSVQTMTVTELLAIYSGQIDNWGRVGGPEQPIYPLIRDGGTTLSRVIQSIPGFDGPTVAKATYSSLETKQLLLEHPYTLGFLPMTLAVGTPLHQIRIVDDSDQSSVEIPLVLGLVHKSSLSSCGQRFFDFLSSDSARQVIEQNHSSPMAGQ